MKRTVLAVLLVAAVTARGDGLSRANIPAEAQWVLHLDLEATKATELGAWAMDQLQTGMVSNRLAAFQAVFNFDPRKDLRSMTLFGRGTGQDNAALLAGQFDEGRMLTLLKLNETYRAETVAGHTIHSWVDQRAGVPAAGGEERRLYGCVLENGARVLVAQRPDALRAALAAIDGSPATPTPAPLVAFLPPVEEPLVVAMSETAGLGRMAGNDLFRHARGGWLTIGEKQGEVRGTLCLEAGDAKTAGLIRDVIQGSVAAGLLGGDRRPELGRMAAGATVQAEDARVTVQFSYATESAVALLQQLLARRVERAPGGRGEGRRGDPR